jgi:hypothetical protein
MPEYPSIHISPAEADQSGEQAVPNTISTDVEDNVSAEVKSFVLPSKRERRDGAEQTDRPRSPIAKQRRRGRRTASSGSAVKNEEWAERDIVSTSPNVRKKQSALGRQPISGPPSPGGFGVGADLLHDKDYELLQPTIRDWEKQSVDVITRYYAQAEV